MPLPKLTHKQQEIIRHLYRYRFLDRSHIQALLDHKDKRRIITWLKDLREKQYVEWIYDSDDFAAKTKPAVYYLKLNGIRLLRSFDEYSSEELRKRYRESSRQQDFINRCLLLADCCVEFESQKREGAKYFFATQADYIHPESDYNFLTELTPHLYVSKQVENTTTHSLLEIFDTSLPHYQMRKRLKDYVEYLDGGEWEYNTGNDEPPTVLFVFSTTAQLMYAKRRVRKLLEDIDVENVQLSLTTIDQIRADGITGRIWSDI